MIRRSLQYFLMFLFQVPVAILFAVVVVLLTLKDISLEIVGGNVKGSLETGKSQFLYYIDNLYN